MTFKKNEFNIPVMHLVSLTGRAGQAGLGLNFGGLQTGPNKFWWSVGWAVLNKQWTGLGRDFWASVELLC